jgi:ABC-type nitrate/sulfonate/bicarbonate transport system permease component
MAEAARVDRGDRGHRGEGRAHGPTTRVARAFVPWALPLLAALALEAWARTVGRGSDAVAAPSAALAAWFAAARDGSLWQGTWFTLGAAGAGLAIGFGLGSVAGLVLGRLPRAAAASFLTVEVLRPVPSVALVPLSMLVFGFGTAMEVAIVAFATFWPALVYAQAAARQVEPLWLEAAAALQLSRAAVLAKVVLPSTVPRLFVSLRLAVAIALVVAVTVEIAANPHGIGYALIVAQQSLDPAAMLGWLLWLGVVGWLVNAGASALARVVEARMGASPGAAAR